LNGKRSLWDSANGWGKLDANRSGLWENLGVGWKARGSGDKATPRYICRPIKDSGIVKETFRGTDLVREKKIQGNSGDAERENEKTTRRRKITGSVLLTHRKKKGQPGHRKTFLNEKTKQRYEWANDLARKGNQENERSPTGNERVPRLEAIE